VLAGAVMALRLLGVGAVMAPGLLRTVAWPLGVFAVLSLASGWLVTRRRGPLPAEAGALSSPFELGLVLKLALVLAVVMAAARALSAVYGSAGLLPISAFAGLVDVDAVALAVTRMTVQDGLNLHLAGQAVLVAALVDSGSKTAIAVVVGGRRFGAVFAGATVLALAGGGLAFALMEGLSRQSG
jgi:uncharacterized membrane protein (DUF4010 family)